MATVRVRVKLKARVMAKGVHPTADVQAVRVRVKVEGKVRVRVKGVHPIADVQAAASFAL